VLCVLIALWTGAAAAQNSGAQPHPKHPIAGPEVTTAELRPIKFRVGETCPTDTTIYGEIYTNGATAVKYTWVSSDGRSWPTRDLNFTSATHKEATEKWKLGAPGKKVNKWIKLQILSPNRLLSNKVDLDFTCAK
jgi:hypothetical protein